MPYGMQRLLSSAVWDVDRVRDELRAYALEQLGTREAILALDETSFPKAGHHSASAGTRVLRHDGARGELPGPSRPLYPHGPQRAPRHTLVNRTIGHVFAEGVHKIIRCRACGLAPGRIFSSLPPGNWPYTTQNE